MVLKRKTMRRTEWTGIEERKYAFMTVENDLFCGKAGLLRMERVEKPFSVTTLGRRVQITGQGYTWLQLAPANENFWATVMFDECGKLIEHYFDITFENVFEEEDAYFIDLILDVVMDDRGETETLDEDELTEALEAGEITQAQYGLSKAAHIRLTEFLLRHKRAWNEMCTAIRKELLQKL